MPAKHLTRWTPFALLCIVGCTAVPISKDADYGACSRQGGFDKGFNDGRAAKPMNSRFAHYCQMENREEIERAYHDGYLSARGGDSNKAVVAVPSAPSNGGSSNQSGNNTAVNINIGGVQTTGGVAPPAATAPSQNSKAYYCKVTRFFDTFDAFGATQVEARKTAIDACVVKNNFRDQCEQGVECQKNE